MYSSSDDELDIFDYLADDKPRWWVSAFGPTLPKELTDWLRAPKTKKLSARDAQSKAKKFIKNLETLAVKQGKQFYFARIKMGLEEKEDQQLAGIDTFTFDATQWHTGTLTTQQGLNNDVTSSLRYIVKDVVDDDILGRLRALFVQAEHPDQLPWRDVVKAMGMFATPGPLKLLHAATTSERKSSA